MVKDSIQNYPSTDSPHHDAFEGIAELYFETKGYITSSGKWFWKKVEGNKQRGYQDIDVLAINDKETLIVSASSCFNDKISFSKGEINKEKTEFFLNYYTRVEEYLSSTEQYKWLVKDRKIVKVLAVSVCPKNMTRYKKFLNEHEILLVDRDEILSTIFKYNGLYLAGMNGADKAVISYFAYFHDCMRENEEIDHGHGWRGAEFAMIHRKLIDLDDDQFEVFYDACRWHTDDNESDCLTLNTCRDADRLDLSRVGIIPDPEFLFNEEAKKIARTTSSWQEVQEYIDQSIVR